MQRDWGLFGCCYLGIQPSNTNLYTRCVYVAYSPYPGYCGANANPSTFFSSKSQTFQILVAKLELLITLRFAASFLQNFLAQIRHMSID